MSDCVEMSTLTRAEVYQLAVYWTQQPDGPPKPERLLMVSHALGRPALSDAQGEAVDEAEFDEDEGELLSDPWIERPDALCPNFEPTAEERQVLDTLYEQAANRCLEALAGLTRVLARWQKAA